MQPRAIVFMHGHGELACSGTAWQGTDMARQSNIALNDRATWGCAAAKHTVGAALAAAQHMAGRIVHHVQTSRWNV
jgi:hypothetical protein